MIPLGLFGAARPRAAGARTPFTIDSASAGTFIYSAALPDTGAQIVGIVIGRGNGNSGPATVSGATAIDHTVSHPSHEAWMVTFRAAPGATLTLDTERYQRTQPVILGWSLPHAVAPVGHAYQTGGQVHTLTADTASGGCALAAVISGTNWHVPHDWTGLTEDTDQLIRERVMSSASADTTSGQVTATATIGSYNAGQSLSLLATYQRA